MPVINPGSGKKKPDNPPNTSAFANPGRILGIKTVTTDEKSASNNATPTSHIPTETSRSKAASDNNSITNPNTTSQPQGSPETLQTFSVLKAAFNPLAKPQASPAVTSSNQTVHEPQYVIVPVQPTLPQGWTAYQKELTREIPTPASRPATAISSNQPGHSTQSGVIPVSQALPHGWTTCQDSDGRVYYWDEVGKKAQWEIPTTLSSLATTVAPSNQVARPNTHPLAVTATQPLPGNTLQIRPDVSQLEHFVTSKQASNFSRTDIIDTSKREPPITGEYGERTWSYKGCLPGCLANKNRIDFPHAHVLADGHFIEGETWWVGTPKQVTVKHPLMDHDLKNLSPLQILGYIDAIRAVPARQLVLQDDNNLGWLSRGWINERGIEDFEGRRKHSVQNLEEELGRRLKEGLIPVDANGEADRAALFAEQDQKVSAGERPNLLTAAPTNPVLRWNGRPEYGERRRPPRPRAIMPPPADFDEHAFEDEGQIPADEIEHMIAIGVLLDVFGRPVLLPPPEPWGPGPRFEDEEFDDFSEGDEDEEEFYYQGDGYGYMDGYR